MTIQEVIDMAKFGELRNLKLGTSEDQILVSYMNLGLVELYKRFALSIKEIIVITSQTEEIIYSCPSDYMWLISAYNYKVIPDNAPKKNPYAEDYQLSINDEEDILSLRIMNWNQIKIPKGIKNDGFIRLKYAASPDATQKIIYNIDNIYLQNELALPAQLIEPLLLYMGYRAYISMDTKTDTESNPYQVKFEQSCKRIEKEGMLTDDSMHMNRITDKGFI